MTISESSPFFIVGAQRSGTTMLRLMLNQHSRLCVPFESAFIPEFASRLSEFEPLSSPDNVAALLKAICGNPFVTKGELIPDPTAVLARQPSTYSELIDAIYSEYVRARQKPRWGDKTPGYVVDIDLLWGLFPGCKFVHLIRDGRDVAMSLRSLPWGSKNLIKTATDWSWKVTLGRKMGAMIPGHYLEVHYETLIQYPAESLARICAFLNEPFEEAMLTYHQEAQSQMPAHSLRWHKSSVSSPDPAKVQSWKTEMSTSDRFVFEQVAGETLELFGYERSTLRPTLGKRLHFARYALLGHA